MGIGRFAGLGAASGLVTGLVLLAIAGGRLSDWLYVVPGAVFGVVFAVMVWRAAWLRAAGFAVASLAANAAAVFVALRSFEAVGSVVGQEFFATVVVGLEGGILGAGLLAGACAGLFGMRGVVWPVAAGGVAGLLLPLLVYGDMAGLVGFYVVWQGVFAAGLGKARLA